MPAIHTPAVTMIRINTLYPCLYPALLALLLGACSSPAVLPRLDEDAVILAFGDSLTEGKGAREAESYPAVLAELTGRRVINGGISGEVSERGLRRLPGLLEKHDPDLLILCHGGNDILRKLDLERMAANIRGMIAMARERGIPVVLLGVPEPGLFLSASDQYSEIAEATGVVFIEDVIADVLSDTALKSDTVHPNGDGYRAMAEAIHALLREVGAV